MRLDRTNTLYCRWSKRENDLLYHYPQTSDGSVLAMFFESLRTQVTTDKVETSLREELDKRGYDLKTLKFSIKRKGCEKKIRES